VERLESAAWPLAGGVLCAFVIAVVLKGAPWPAAFAVAVASVAAWSPAMPPVGGALLGLAAWAFVTGFDVVGSGDLVVGGPGDAARAAVLIGVGVAGGVAGALARRRRAAHLRHEPGPHVVPLQRDRRTERPSGRPSRHDLRQGRQR
jgi:hypothetical protein